ALAGPEPRPDPAVRGAAAGGPARGGAAAERLRRAAEGDLAGVHARPAGGGAPGPDHLLQALRLHVLPGGVDAVRPDHDPAGPVHGLPGGQGAQEAGQLMSVLSIEGLWKSFGDHAVLRGIDLEVHQHEVVSLIGASGSGKSTLLRCVNLLETPDDGTILLDGEEITDPRVDVDAVRKRFGTVFQAFNLFPHMTVLDNITLAPRQVHGVPRAEAEEAARELLARFGLSDKADAYPDRLS